MAASSRRIAQICREDIAPGGAEATRAWVGALQGLGFQRTRGVRARPVLMKMRFVQEVMLQEAVSATINSTEPSLDFVPDMAGVGDPIWRHDEHLSRKESKNEEKEGGKKAAAKVKGSAKLPARRLTAGRALATMQWTEDEEKLIREAKGKRQQGREKLRLMHNRTADEKGHHRIKKYQNDGKIWCEKCGQWQKVKRISQWPMTKCQTNAERGKVKSHQEFKGAKRVKPEESCQEKTKRKGKTV